MTKQMTAAQKAKLREAQALAETMNQRLDRIDQIINDLIKPA